MTLKASPPEERESPSARARHGVAPWIAPAAILIFAAAAYWFSTQFEEMPPILKRGLQPSDFPQLIIGLLVFLTIVMVLRDPIEAPEPLKRSVWLTLGLMIAFALITPVDFFLALGLSAAGMALVWGERRPQHIALVGILTPALIFFLFDQVFSIRFPRGLLTSLWYG